MVNIQTNFYTKNFTFEYVVEQKEVLKVIYDTLDEINLELDDGKKIEKSQSTGP